MMEESEVEPAMIQKYADLKAKFFDDTVSKYDRWRKISSVLRILTPIIAWCSTIVIMAAGVYKNQDLFFTAAAIQATAATLFGMKVLASRQAYDAESTLRAMVGMKVEMQQTPREVVNEPN